MPRSRTILTENHTKINELKTDSSGSRLREQVGKILNYENIEKNKRISIEH